jgi:predicted GNAT superfamily acetyltransferase
VTSDRPNPVIRRLVHTDEFHAAEDAQRVIWSMVGDTEVVPAHLLITAQKNGGLVLGAFDEEGAMVGFLFGFPGQAEDGRLKHCSHMMGVHPEWRSRGLGYRLKRAQRGHVLRQGLDLITWTYDPLEGANAHLNLGKLGAISRTYLRDVYGRMRDELNVGLPTDRFQVEWWIRSERVRAWLAAGGEFRTRDQALVAGAIQVNRVELIQHLPESSEAFGKVQAPLLVPADWAGLPDADRLLVEIPTSIQAIKRADSALALAWRLHTRAIFEACFTAGYAAVDFLSERLGGTRRNFYLLERGREGEWTGASDPARLATPLDLDAALRQGVTLFNAGQFWRCHEVLEAAWRQVGDETDRLFLQALIQAAAGLHKWTVQGNRAGLEHHLERSLAKLAQFPQSYRGLDVVALRTALQRCLDQAGQGTTGISAPQIALFPLPLGEG